MKIVILSTNRNLYSTRRLVEAGAVGFEQGDADRASEFSAAGLPGKVKR